MIHLRDFMPIGRLTTGLAAIALLAVTVLLIARAWGGLSGWLPWSDGRRLARAETRLDQARTDLEHREAEIAALERQAERATVSHQTLAEARTITVRAATLAERATDANDPIDPTRADRLRDADRRLCGLVPDLCTRPNGPPARARP